MTRVGDCSLFQAAGVLGGGEHLPATATAGARAPTASASNSRRRPALLGVGVPLVRRLAKVLVDRETRDGIGVAPPGLAGLLASAFKMGREGRPPPNRARVTRPHSAHGVRESPMGPTADPSGAGKAWFPGLCADHRKVYASSVGWGAISELASVPQATSGGDLGLRLPLRADGLLSNALCVLRC